MSFRDFNDEGPGTFEWDFVLGGNTTGLFPEETHYELDGTRYKAIINRRYKPGYGRYIVDLEEI